MTEQYPILQWHHNLVNNSPYTEHSDYLIYFGIMNSTTQVALASFLFREPCTLSLLPQGLGTCCFLCLEHSYQPTFNLPLPPHPTPLLSSGKLSWLSYLASSPHRPLPIAAPFHHDLHVCDCFIHVCLPH